MQLLRCDIGVARVLGLRGTFAAARQLERTPEQIVSTRKQLAKRVAAAGGDPTPLLLGGMEARRARQAGTLRGRDVASLADAIELPYNAARDNTR